MNPQQLLGQFLGPDTADDPSQPASKSSGMFAGNNLGGIAGGLAAGGLLGLLVGNKKVRKTVGRFAGGAVAVGGATALGALAYRAYRNWQDGNNAPPPVGQPANVGESSNPAAFALPPKENRFLPGAAPASDGRPFEFALVTAMISAANADGHIGREEMKGIFNQVNSLSLEADDKAFVFEALHNPPSIQEIADLAINPEQASEIYLASRLAIEPDHPGERAYLDELARRLDLPPGLVAHLDGQASENEERAA